mgnify:CR=1 FL=1
MGNSILGDCNTGGSWRALRIPHPKYYLLWIDKRKVPEFWQVCEQNHKPLTTSTINENLPGKHCWGQTTYSVKPDNGTWHQPGINGGTKLEPGHRICSYYSIFVVYHEADAYTIVLKSVKVAKNCGTVSLISISPFPRRIITCLYAYMTAAEYRNTQFSYLEVISSRYKYIISIIKTSVVSFDLISTLITFFFFFISCLEGNSWRLWWSP